MLTYRQSDSQGKEWRTPESRAEERQRLQQQVNAWLAAGNQATTMPFGLSVYSPQEQWEKLGSLGLQRKE